MKHQTTKCLLLIAAFLTAPAFAEVADSTIVKPAQLVPVSETYMLAHGQIATSIDNYIVNVNATNLRCSRGSEPTFITNLASVDVYGAAQAIEGVNNTLTLNPDTYEITGVVSAPVNVAARDNGARVNWQIWCKQRETA